MGNWLSSVLDSVSGTILAGIRTLCFSLCSFIYQAIIFVYNIFDKLCSGRFLSNEILQAFAERIGVILGLVMAFIVIFSLIKMVLDPEKVSDKEMGAAALVKRIIFAIVMLGVSTYVFNLLYTVQKVVIESNAISKLFLPVQIDEENSDNFGNILSVELLSAFYYIDEEQFKDNVPAEVSNCIGTVNEFKNQIIQAENFQLGYQCLNEAVEVDSSEVFIVNYNWLLSIVVGVIVLYLLFVYCIKVGVRMAQLMFLEIIAPMAIVSYVAPKKKTMFSEWIKIYVSTYIDVFIRIAIINFVVFIIATIFTTTENGFEFWGSIGDTTTTERNFILVIIIIALLTFAKKAPDLLKDLLGSSASKLGFGVSSPKQLFDGMLGGTSIRKGVTAGAKMATAGTAIGLLSSIASGTSRFKANKAAGKGTRAALMGAAGGALTAYGRGLIAGSKKGNMFSNISKGMANQHKIDDNYESLIESGGTVPGMLGSKASGVFGKTPAQVTDRIIRNIKALSDYYGEMKKYSNDLGCVKTAQSTATLAVKEDAVYENDEQYKNRINRVSNLTAACNDAVKAGKSIFEFEGKTFDISSSEGKSEYAEALKQAKIDSSDTSRKMLRAAETDAEFVARKQKLEEKVRKMRAAAEEAIVTESYRTSTDDEGNLVYEFDFKFDGNVETLTLSGDDIAKAGAIKTVAKEASHYSESHGVERYDSNSDEMVKVGKITKASQLKQMEEYMNETITHVKDEKYFKHKAEDVAAGVKDNGGKK